MPIDSNVGFSTGGTGIRAIQQRSPRAFSPQPTLQRAGMSFGVAPPMQRANPMAARPARPMEPRSAQFGGMPTRQFGGMAGGARGGAGMAQMSQAAPAGRPAPGAGSGGMAGGVASMFGGGGGGGVASNAGKMAGLFSDERSKERIKELEGLTKRYEALLDGPSAEMPSREELDRGASSLEGSTKSFEPVGSHEYAYKPEFQDKPGAGRGRFAGPMTSELKQIPGVVEEGHDGMERVNPGRLALANASATGELSREKADRAELEALRARFEGLEDDPDAVLRGASGR